ncbi:hypothetical protein [Cerasicoccus arenae]|uniref:Uncharacterized protein n=1 Tax=Cerasicoccus arenae TaxID=424488 RepID=A0A8J3GDK2_9BACT|nr:hypothetical protein [Cerasicoccus arenae]MBK1858252.1 hypothetical protein [Cerasicoccus arenae]GHC02178.1 hypothetical protein GCM10007047_18380 [Cerasicoccus arenae]
MSKKISQLAAATTIPENAQILIYDPDEANDADKLKRYTGKLCTNDAYTVAGVPTAADYTGVMIYVSNGAAGSPVMAFSNGTNWLRCDTRAAIAAS